MHIGSHGKKYGFSLDTPYGKYPKKIHDILIYGTNGKSVKVHYRGQRGVGVYDVAFEGLIKNVERRYRETGSDSTKQEYETFMRVTPCQACHGQRLKPTSLGVTVGDKNIFEVTSLSIDNLQKFMQNLELSEQQLLIGKQILKEIRARVSFLADVGLNYLTLARGTASLSGGGAENPSGNAVRLRPCRCRLYSRRAEHRSSPERQRQTSRDAETSA